MAPTPMTQMVKNLPAVQETWVQSLGRENPLEKDMATHSSILALRILCTESLVGYSPWGCKELNTNVQLTDTHTHTHTHTHTFLTDLLLTASVATSYNREIEVGAQRSLESRNR